MKRGVEVLCCAAALVALTMVPAVPALGNDAVRVRGLVFDSAGLPLPGVEVLIGRQENALGNRVTTDRRGRFTVKLGDGGREYWIRLEKSGYRRLVEQLRFDELQAVELSFVLRTEAEAAADTAEREAAEARETSARLYNEGAEAYNTGDEERALELLGRAVVANPDLAPAHAALAKIHLERREWTEAAAAAERLGELAPGAGPLLLLYDAVRGMAHRERSEALRAELVARYPGPEIAVRVFNEGVEAWRSGEQGEATELLMLALDLDSSLVDAHLGLATVLEAEGRFEQALEHVEAYLGSKADDLAALELRLRMLERLERVEEAVELRRRLEQSDPQRALRAHFEEGVRHYHAGRVEVAIEAFTQALAIDPDHPRSHYQLGLCFASQGRSADARLELERYLDLAPDAPDAESVRRMLDFLE